LGETLWRPHPVAEFGRLMTAAERVLYADSVAAGAAYTALGLATGLLAGAASGSTAAAAYLATAGNALTGAAAQVSHALRAGDLDRARALLPALVGRDTSELGAAGITRAVVESVAENTVDAIVAPATYAALAGPAGALGYRAVNTMDSMIGHLDDRYRRFGRTAARLDDAANYVPARITAALVAAVRPHRAAPVWRAVRRDAPAHPSPNAGVAEAAFAAALGIQLGGTVSYRGRTDRRPVLGTGRPPAIADIARATALCRDVTLALVACLAAAGTGRGRP
jgi:adenosylcobinamide-phosphate synthase